MRIFKEILKIKLEKMQPRSYFQSLNKVDKNLVFLVLENTKYLINVKFNERLYHIIFDKFEKELCPICKQNELKFLDFNRGYSKSCSTKCSWYNTDNITTKERSSSISKTKRDKSFDSLVSIYQSKGLDIISEKEMFIELGKITFSCSACNKKYSREMNKQMSIRRCDCYLAGKSRPEREVSDYIENLGFKTELNSKRIIYPLQIDIFLNEFKLAIEYNGLFWHSEKQGVSQNYHLNKTKLCLTKEIQLLHIFENEWLDLYKQNIWKSIISGKLGINQKIGARKCEIKFISKESNVFLDENHLQGKDKSSIRIGLFFKNDLVSVLTFAKPRYNKNYDWEIVRFANKKFTNIIGGFSKLLSYFKKHYQGSIITYADKRYSNGDLYRKNGFLELEDSKPNYWYIKGQKLYSRIGFQKHKLKDILEVFDETKTESENMLNNGWNRIFDCGNKVFILR